MKNCEVEVVILLAKLEDAMEVIEVGVDRVTVTEEEEGINCNLILQRRRKWPLVQAISRVK